MLKLWWAKQSGAATKSMSEAKSKLKPIEIGFGYVFEESGSGYRHVITSVREGKSFWSSPITEVDGNETLTSFSTGDRQQIRRMTKERWAYERVEKAFMMGYEDTEPVGKLYDMMKEESKKEPRMLYHI